MKERSFGPTILERLRQGSNARLALLEQTISLSRKPFNRDPGSRSEKRLDIPGLIKKLPKPIQRAAQVAFAAGSIGILTAAVCEANEDETGQRNGQGDWNEPKIEQTGNLERILPVDNPTNSYITGGPHSDGLSAGIRNSLDFAFGRDSVKCPGGEPITDRFAIVATDGEVYFVGSDKKTDKYHSTVAIKDGEGKITFYSHLANITVEKGQQVKAGDQLGNPSCEFPAGGKTYGIHLHIAMFQEVVKEGKTVLEAVPVEGYEFGGWQVVELPGDYQGKLVQENKDDRIADTRRCGPDQQTIDICGLRNDLAEGTILGTVETPEATPTQVTSIPTSTETEVPHNTLTPEVVSNREGIFDLGNWEIGILSWDEKPFKETIDYSGNVTTETREGWKYVTVQARGKNLYAGVANNGNPSTGEEFDFQIVSNGFNYVSEGGDYEPYYFQVPVGFSYPLTIGTWVPETQTDYSLAVYPSSYSQLGEILGEIKRGTVALDYPFISPDTQILGVGEKWVIPDFAEVSFNKFIVNDCYCLNIYQEQFASFNVLNTYGYDIGVDYGDIVLRIFLKDGRVIEGSEYFYSENISYPLKIAPGLQKQVDLNFGATDEYGGEIYDTQGSVIVAFMNGEWAAWQLP